LLALRPVAGSNKPGEFGDGSTPMILAAAESIRLAGILFPGKGVLVPGWSTMAGEAEKSPFACVLARHQDGIGSHGSLFP
jgi:hypothetical protein